MFEGNDRRPPDRTCDVGRTGIDGDHGSSPLENRGPLMERQTAKKRRDGSARLEGFRELLAVARAGNHDRCQGGEAFDDRQRSFQRASIGEPTPAEMHDDWVIGQFARRRPVRVGDVEPKGRDSPLRAGQRDEVEQLHDFVPDDAMRIAIAERGVGLRNHDAVDVEPRGDAGEPAPLVGISDAKRCARRADELEIDGTRRECDRDVITAKPGAERSGAIRIAKDDQLVDVVVAFHHDAVVFARDDRQMRLRKGGPYGRNRGRREHQIADPIGAR